MPDIAIGGIYLHYKNKKYRVTAIARHSETLEEMVVYEALYDNELGSVWVRPKSMFTEEVDIGGYCGPRFRLIEE